MNIRTDADNMRDALVALREPEMIDYARACYPTDVAALAAHLDGLPRRARDAFARIIDGGEGWDAAAIAASLAAPGVRVNSPFGTRVRGELVR